MKKAKRIFAGMAAAVMAFSTMSIGASAETRQIYNVSVYYNSSSPQYSHPTYQNNVTVNKTTQSISGTITTKPSNSSYVNAKNSIDAALDINCYYQDTTYSVSKNISFGAIGTTTSISASWKDYSYGAYTCAVTFDV